MNCKNFLVGTIIKMGNFPVIHPFIYFYRSCPMINPLSLDNQYSAVPVDHSDIKQMVGPQNNQEFYGV